MKKKIIIAIIISVLTGCNVFTGYEWWKTDRERRAFFSLIESQNSTIDSLVNHPAKSVRIEAKMDLTDKSKFEINGKNNSGTINVPNERKYLLEVQFDTVTVFCEQ